MAELALTARLKALIGFRALFVTLLLGSAFLFKIEHLGAPSPYAISYFIIFLYAQTIFYSLLIGRIKNLLWFAYTQMLIDVFSAITLISITGGIGSWFSFLLILTVLSSSIIIGKTAGYFTAGLSSIMYGLLVTLQFYKAVPLQYEGDLTEKQLLYNVFIHIISLFVTAYLSGYLSHRLEKTVQKLEEKDSHLKDLELFNIKVIESLPSGLFTTDLQGNTVIFNRAAEKITGIRREDVIGRKIETALPFLIVPFKDGRHEEELYTAQGIRKTIGITLSVLLDITGAETGFIGTFQDLTELKRLEADMKQKEKWAAIGELSANIAHEIRNPLASLRGSIEMLREDKIPVKHRQTLMDIALQEMGRLNHTITDFLTYSNPKPLDKQTVDVHALLNETLELLKNSEHNKANITIEKNFSGSLILEVDPSKIRQVFWNLGINAVEAISSGGRLSVSTKEDLTLARILFTDTGSGINAQDLDKIFYPFFTTKEHGTGLGLAIAYRIVEEHTGRLSARSTPGINTTFEIILPKQHERQQRENPHH